MDVWFRQSSSGRSAAAAQQKSNTRNPYLTTDASMATNVEDKADKKPLRNTKTRNVRKPNKNQKKKSPNGLHIVVKILSR